MAAEANAEIERVCTREEKLGSKGKRLRASCGLIGPENRRAMSYLPSNLFTFDFYFYIKPVVNEGCICLNRPHIYQFGWLNNNK